MKVQINKYNYFNNKFKYNNQNKYNQFKYNNQKKYNQFKYNKQKKIKNKKYQISHNNKNKIKKRLNILYNKNNK